METHTHQGNLKIIQSTPLKISSVCFKSHKSLKLLEHFRILKHCLNGPSVNIHFDVFSKNIHLMWNSLMGVKKNKQKKKINENIFTLPNKLTFHKLQH